MLWYVLTKLSNAISADYELELFFGGNRIIFPVNLCDNPGMSDLPASPPPFPQSSPQMPPFKAFGGYEIEGELGRGGMGVVYLARQVELNRRVALKMLTGHYGPDELQRFLEEVGDGGRAQSHQHRSCLRSWRARRHALLLDGIC